MAKFGIKVHDRYVRLNGIKYRWIDKLSGYRYCGMKFIESTAFRNLIGVKYE